LAALAVARVLDGIEPRTAVGEVAEIGRALVGFLMSTGLR
jgi:hypothetical protein